MTIETVQDAIVARLVARFMPLPSTPNAPENKVRKVYTAAELSQVEEQSQVCPHWCVVYNGYEPVDSEMVAASQGAIQQVRFNWLVVLGIRNAKGTATHQGAREDAAPLLDEALAALMGFRPATGYSPLVLEPAPGAGFTDKGFAYYPLAFTTGRTYRGTP